ISWGSGDFSGGFASRRVNQFQVLFLATLSSLGLLTVLAVLAGESLPSLSSTIYAVLAGISGALGLVALYTALLKGNAALVAPVAGVLGAVVPMIIGIVKAGSPSSTQQFGFGLALVGIWLVTRSNDADNPYKPGGLGLAVLAGIGFGGFLGLIALVDQDQIFAPLVLSKLASICIAAILVWSSKQSLPSLTSSPVALLSGFLDAGGNMLYLAATHFTRLDVVAVLASLYPVVTVLLSNILLKEKSSLLQWLGVLLCMAAITLITT
ncbi:MAG: DMT family transporter, partial [Anaerolineales bacterium]|nr:DMT family transporter [Anaerolineales bacterium]